jgi:hypothetical protein
MGQITKNSSLIGFEDLITWKFGCPVPITEVK